MTNQIIQANINTIVPANNSLNVINLNPDNSPVKLVYPTTFVQSPYYVAGAMIIEQPTDFSGGIIELPNALVIAQGIVCQFVNLSTLPFNINDFEGNFQRQVEAGQNVMAYLLPDPNGTPTSAGNWYFLTIGTGTSGADAVALAGFGLEALPNNKLNCFVQTIVQNVPFTLVNGYDASLLVWTGGTYTLDLDGLVDPIPGFYMMVKNSSAAVLTLAATNIDGGTAIDLTPNQSCIVVYDNTNNNWKTVGLGAFSFGNAIQFTSTGIRLINGTETNPSLAYITDPATGIFSHGTSDVSITNSGAQSISFTQAGPILYVGNYLLGGDLLLEYAGIYP